MKFSSLKRLSISVLLALGISPAFAEDVNNEETRTVKYGGILTMNGFYGNDGNSTGSVDLWQPLWQEWNKVAFLDIRGVKGDNQIWEGNLGGGYRWLSPEAKYLYGAYAFYDNRNSILGNQFQQATVGAELKGERWSVTGNYYIPFGDNKYYETSLDQAQLSSVQGDGYQNLLISNGYEQALTGFDIELGHEIPYAKGLRFYGAYYYFVPPAGVDTVQGHRLSIDYRLDQALNWSVEWVNRFSFKASWQYDQVRGNIYTAGFEVALPLSRAARNSTALMSPLQQQMTAYVRRDVDIVTIQDNEDFTPYQLNGHDAKIYTVDNATDLAARAQDPNADILVLAQDITTDQQITVVNNQMITGQNIEYKPGVLFNATGEPTPSTVYQLSPGVKMFVVGSGNMVRDLNISYVSTPTVVGITNNTTSNNGVGTFVMDNVTSNAGVSIIVSDGSTNSNITIENSTFNMQQAGTAINIQASTDSTVTVAFISDNVITFGALNNSTGISLTMNDGATAFNVGSVTGNTITMGLGGQNKGISVINNSTDKDTLQKVQSITDNTITLGGSINTVNYGIFLSNASDAKQEVTAVKENTVTFSSGDYNFGLYVNNSDQFADTVTNATKGLQFIGGISNNHFIFPTIDNTIPNSQSIFVYTGGHTGVDASIPVTLITGMHDNTSNNTNAGITLSNDGHLGGVIAVFIGNQTACTVGKTCQAALSEQNDNMIVTKNPSTDDLITIWP